MLLLLVLTATVAAVRGLWSPCGLSMLSQLNPVAERARGHRFAATAGWYVAGAVAGGALLGGACALGALAAGRLPADACWVMVLLAAAAAVASDSRAVRWALPDHPRQVDERWLVSYRRWIYAGGYGAQIGAGFATYVMTAAVYLTAALAVLTGAPLPAFAGGVLFGLVRGLTIAVAGLARDPERLRALLRRVDACDAVSLQLAGLTAVAVAAAAAWRLAGAVPAVAVALVLTAVMSVGSRRAVPAR